MLILPCGITGFDAKPTADLKRFRAGLYTAARTHGFTVSEPVPQQPEDVCSYVRAEVTSYSTNIVVLLNVYASWLAFSLPPERHKFDYQFCNFPQLGQHFTQCKVTDADYLAMTPKAVHLSKLSRTEQGEIRAWRPANIGEIVFNSWD